MVLGFYEARPGLLVACISSSVHSETPFCPIVPETTYWKPWALEGGGCCHYPLSCGEGGCSRKLKLAKRLDYSPPLSWARLCGVCSCSTTSSRTCMRPTSSSSMFRCLILARLTASARIARAPIATAPAALAPTAKAPRLVHPSPVATRANATCLPNGGCSSCLLALRFLTVLSFPRFSSETQTHTIGMMQLNETRCVLSTGL